MAENVAITVVPSSLCQGPDSMDIPFFAISIKGKTSQSELFIAPRKGYSTKSESHHSLTKYLNINTQFFPVQFSCQIYIILTFLQSITARCRPKYSSWEEVNGLEIYWPGAGLARYGKAPRQNFSMTSQLFYSTHHLTTLKWWPLKCAAVFAPAFDKTVL